MYEAGKIGDRERYNQPIDFTGLRYKNITPSDIDGKIFFFEIRKSIFVFIELKWRKTLCRDGQYLAFQNLTDIIPVPAIYIIAEHEVDDCNRLVIAHNCLVREFRYQNKWHVPKKECTLKNLIDWFLRKYGFAHYIKHIPE